MPMRRLLASVVLTAAALQAQAQEDAGPTTAAPPDLEAATAGGQSLTATVTQGFTVDTNLGLDDPSPGTSYYADTGLLLGFQTQTQVQSFEFALDTGLRALKEADEDFELTFASPTGAALDYGYDWANGGIDTSLRYRQRDLDAASTALIVEDDDDPEVDDTDEVEDATERRYDVGVSLALATQSPSSYALNFAGTQFDYTGDAAEARERRTLEGDALWRLQLTPVIAGTLGAAYSDFQAENRRETEIREAEIDVGVIYEPSEVLQASFGIGYARYERDELGEDEDREDSGLVLRGGLRYAFEDVTLVGTARLTNAAPETRLSGDVRASYPLPNGTLTGRVFRSFGGGVEGDEIQVTGATIGLDHEINTVSGVGFDVALARRENLDADEPDSDRLSFTAAYSHDLTEAVSASLGYRFSAEEEDPDSATSNAVFFEIGRTFETRP
jgi:hypothetical protein